MCLTCNYLEPSNMYHFTSLTETIISVSLVLNLGSGILNFPKPPFLGWCLFAVIACWYAVEWDDLYRSNISAERLCNWIIERSE